MTEHFNKLTPAEAERLAWLMEECGEVIQAAGKILRHGYDSTDPTNPDHAGNRADLERELCDILQVIIHMQDRKDLVCSLFERARWLSANSKFKYMHHQDEE